MVVTRLGLAVAVIVAASAAAAPARAFDPVGHEIIEAAAYKRLLATAEVEGAGVSGRAVLAALIAQKVLAAPLCFDQPSADGCTAEALREAPLRAWPHLGSGAADLLIDRQLDERGQCQHFMAQTADGRSPVDPRLGVPGALATTAYSRCVQILGAVLDNILRHPNLSTWRVAGMYVLMHAVEDSFSPAHVRRDPTGRIVHLNSWNLIDWPVYLWHWQLHFPRETHHGLTDERDATFLVEGGRAADGRACSAFPEAYSVPEECLGAEARAAVSAIVDLLVLTYTLRQQAASRGQLASLRSDAGREAWMEFVRAHLPSTSTGVAIVAPPVEAPPRPDVFLGVIGSWRPDGWGAGLWGGRLLYGLADPFAIGLFGGAGVAHHVDGGDALIGTLALSLHVPLVRRFAIGFSPATLQVTCTTDLGDCATEGQMTIGNVIVRLGPAWVALQGPTWSWNQREFRDARLSVAVGWWHERHPREAPYSEGPPGWQPPAPGDVRAYRLRRTTTLGYLMASAASSAQDRLVGAGFETFLDRDRWNRRAGFAPGLGLGFSGGLAGGVHTGILGAAALARAYLVPGRVALVLAPAVAGVRTGTPDPHGSVDVGARMGLALVLGAVEVRADTPTLSYVASDRWHSHPFAVSIALVLR